MYERAAKLDLDLMVVEPILLSNCHSLSLWNVIENAISVFQESGVKYAIGF